MGGMVEIAAQEAGRPCSQPNCPLTVRAFVECSSEPSVFLVLCSVFCVLGVLDSGFWVLGVLGALTPSHMGETPLRGGTVGFLCSVFCGAEGRAAPLGPLPFWVLCSVFWGIWAPQKVR